MGDGGAFEAAVRYEVLQKLYNDQYLKLEDRTLWWETWLADKISKVGGFLTWLSQKVASKLVVKPISVWINFWPVCFMFETLMEQAAQEPVFGAEPPATPPQYEGSWWPRDAQVAYHEPELGTTCPHNPGIKCYENSNCPWSPQFWEGRPDDPPEEVVRWWQWCVQHGVPIRLRR